MIHCIIKNMYANKLFKIGIIYYFFCVMFLFWELGAVASNLHPVTHLVSDLGRVHQKYHRTVHKYICTVHI
jgi:hypothetical protein